MFLFACESPMSVIFEIQAPDLQIITSSKLTAPLNFLHEVGANIEVSKQIKNRVLPKGGSHFEKTNSSVKFHPLDRQHATKGSKNYGEQWMSTSHYVDRNKTNCLNTNCWQPVHVWSLLNVY